MNLHELKPASGSTRRRRRVGRGHGSGRVKTSGRGTKGQNSRAGGGVKPFFEGGQNPWTMRIPHKRGFSNRRFKVQHQLVNLRDLERVFSAGETVTLDLLRDRGLIDDASGKRPVKILGDGVLTKSLTIRAHAASANARTAIEQAGGTLAVAGGRPAPRPRRRTATDGANRKASVATGATAATAGDQPAGQ